MSKRVVTFGDVIDDIVVVPQGTVRPDTDTTSVIRQTPGGSAANTAAWLAELGVSVDFVGRVGAADFERQVSDMTEAGVTPHLSADPDLPTGRIVIIVDGNVRTMFTDKGANVNFSPDDVTDALLTEAAVVHVGGYSVMHDPDAVRRLIARARAVDTEVSLDPSSAGFLTDFGIHRFLNVAEGASILMPNLDEGRVLTGIEDALAIAAALAERFETVALTLGMDGCVVAGPGLPPTLVGAVPAVLVDPTGAGDSFSAGFLAEWTSSRDAVAAARAGSQVAARAVATIGARPD
ncbi:MAG TPA: carbohydrate kinase family protein [Terrimesophilobacter sp.]|nr:carbohydrate kinase family protein [Terrimesophilobacter sp.]HRQ00136.1 carbohydrate kinase family protein [Terrimesophilobacter sp.]